MCFVSQVWLVSRAILLMWISILQLPQSIAAFGETKNNVKTSIFLSPKFELGPGSVANKYFFDVDFPRGHVAVKSFNAEVVDEVGNPVPLYETYLHHWVVQKYHQPKNVTYQYENISWVRNSGICQDDILQQYYGLGSETRKTDTLIPDPFGVEIGNPANIPKGYDEKWFFNVHAIDTRGVKNRVGCTECRCKLYNITKDGNGNPLSSDYGGGLECCPDESRCKLRNGFQGPTRTLYLRYTIKWINWNHFVVPINVYIFDVTDTLIISNKSKGISPKHDCQIEYQVKPCIKDHKNGNGCTFVNKTSIPMPKGGYVIYGVAHQHIGGLGSTLYGQDGRVICSSTPRYGTGKEAGNEKGYIVGMSTCYPKPGSIKIFDGETITLEVNYSNTKRHTGVMGLFYLLVAEHLPNHNY
ncbi:putative stress up-regulated Nod 19 [Lupinus albus]|uniref:Putative stress up-regulated Nod 19 n=1 Tax=Lupinus albus TaxID=3870 RepID=A0A6A4P0A8_LUPAL|nr:putative stress up-regulated Nod 19 [Lupinus albus]